MKGMGDLLGLTCLGVCTGVFMRALPQPPTRWGLGANTDFHEGNRSFDKIIHMSQPQRGDSFSSIPIPKDVRARGA